MSDTASSSRSARPSPIPGDVVDARAECTPSPEEVVPIHDDQPTVISKQPPIATSPVSDSVVRILEGNIQPGDRLGYYELLQYVGAGGMGLVFRAMDTRLSRTVAVKILPPKHISNQEIRLRFQNEAQSAARLDHPNIARVYYVGEDRGLQFIVFEFVEGIDISALVKREGPLSVAEALSYVLQVAEALVHASDRDVVHRDIKPSNVLITPQGRVKLIDMGLARFRRRDVSGEDLTNPGVTLGSFDYISPEQARDPRSADIRSDIYSLGCTFFFMLAGRPPFPEGTWLQKLLQHQGDQPPDIRQFRPGLPDDVARVLRKMLAKDPRRRYRSAGELVDDLLLLAERVGLQPLGPGGRILVPPRQPQFSVLRRHLPWLGPIAALFIIVGMLNLFWSLGGSQLPPASLGARDTFNGNTHNPANGNSPGLEGSVLPDDPGGEPETPQDKPGEVLPEVPHDDEPTTPGSDTPVHPPDDDDVGDTESEDHSSQPALAPVAPSLFGPWEQLLTSGTDNGLDGTATDAAVSVGGGDSSALSVFSGSESLWGQLSNAAGNAVKPASAVILPGPTAATPRSGLLIVNGTTGEENTFATLSAACSAAADNDVIELRYNGRREERPISMANLRVTVRAGKDYAPVIVFRPSERDPVKYPRSMFTLTAGRLELVNVALELEVPREFPADNWTLLETRGGQAVRLEKCSLSICNASDQLTAYHKEVAFFCAKSAPGTDAVVGEEHATRTPIAAIDLIDCVARGEAVFLRATDVQPISLTWKNGLLVTTEQLVVASGSQQATQPGDMLQIDLRHITAVTYGGLCRMTGSRLAPYQLAAQIGCSNGILMSVANVPLIEQVGADAADDFHEQIAWDGDRNFYEGFDVFWTICDVELEPLWPPCAFEAWESYWQSQHENMPKLDRVRWRQLPSPDRPLHTHTPADYALDDTVEDNPAIIDAATDGSNAGFLAALLPQFPPPRIVEKADDAETPTDRYDVDIRGD